MKKRLILFFEMLKQMGITVGQMTIGFNDSYHNDWDERIRSAYDNKKSYRLPNFMSKVIYDLIDKYSSEIDENNYYDVEDYWYLNFTVDTDKKEIHIGSQCKYEIGENFEYQFDFNDLDEETINTVTQLTNNGEDIIDFEFWGRWDDGEAYNVIKNDKKQIIPSDEPYWLIVNHIMVKTNGRGWNQDNGSTGEVRLWGNDILLDGTNKQEEWKNTNLNLVIKPEDYE
jgi:hypothetical protein